MSEPKRLNFQRAKDRLERALTTLESDSRSEEEILAIYRQRAELLSRPVESDASDAGEGIVVFRLGETRYAAPLINVSEVDASPRVAPAPGAPPEILGLMQVRGEIRVVWNLHRLLGLATPREFGESRTVLLLRSGRGEQGVLVDEVEDIRIVDENRRKPAPEDSEHGAWMTDDLIVVLNIERLLPEGGNAKRSS